METVGGGNTTADARSVAPEELRVVGGNAALDLCNSRSGPHDGGTDIDSLARIEDAVPWALHSGVITDDEATALSASARSASANEAERLLAELHALRDLAHCVFHALASGGEPPAAALDELLRAERRAKAHAHFVRDGDSYRYAWPASDRTAIIDRVAHAAAVLLTEGPLSRVKQCAGCSFLFLDESKNGSRRWCSMDDCGRDAKMRLYVERRRARARTGSTAE